MNVVFLGPPGAGKGTQAETLSKKKNMKHVSTGDLLREAVQAGTATGAKAREYMEKGLLVPDKLVVDIVADCLTKGGNNSSFLLDGFPRNLAQAKALDETLKKLGYKLDGVFYFAVSEKTAVKRLTGRWLCSSCGANYHELYMPPKKAGICDRCGKPLGQRPDDNVETVKKRLKVYHEQTADLIDYYKKRSVLNTIDADRDVGDIRNDICGVLDSLSKGNK
ncbi:MAG TPA: adenylate kinase [Candidatus Avalokitesvara rifleensis]|uniref:adenylate kinase n=1 Tax=Candidatus Avalokitesvara rifleensis TaxID=3367620 RepID=UPI002712FF9E|nr:adenylate kinase [Candidatus Brocadiales bacterium]